MQVCRLVVDCGSIPSAKLSVHGSGHEDEPIALFDLVFGLCVGTVAFPYWIFGALVSGFRSSFGRKAA